jgi:hypothetical protein
MTETTAMPDNPLRREAHHEAAHVVLACLFGHVPQSVQLIAEGRAMTVPAATLEHEEHAVVGCIALAGRAAEHRLLGRRWLKFESYIALSAVTMMMPSRLAAYDARWQLLKQDEFAAAQAVARLGVPSDVGALAAAVERLYAATRKIVSNLWSPISALADHLLDEKTLGSAGIRRALQGHVLEPAPARMFLASVAAEIGMLTI